MIYYSSKGRNEVLDVTKGLGIIFVVLGHLVTYSSPISNFIFTFHMPLFFVISGYFVHNISFENCIRKALSLLLIYFEICVIGTIVTILMVKGNLDIFKVAYEVFWCSQPESLHVGQIWFLIALILTNCLFVILFHLTKGKTKYIFCLSVGLYIVSCLCEFLPVRIPIFGHQLRLPWHFDTVFASILFYTTGYILKECKVLDCLVSTRGGCSKRCLQELCLALLS